ncbi:hypothetical protein ILUMI_14595 [Ignelater luminosus]|uniref:Uncharacterized protein n=1 Tax=Ignelater luminosus TaxID=2038154 RepID=A0A8K0CQ58_IGNLU|nr:hypothetical protein ILUMI_14595 [Ignelater luminosus]
MLKTESPLWTPVFSAYRPPLNCPFRKTVYKAINSTVDVAAFLLFPSDAWYWRVTVEIRERITRNILMCLKAEAHISLE